MPHNATALLELCRKNLPPTNSKTKLPAPNKAHYRKMPLAKCQTKTAMIYQRKPTNTPNKRKKQRWAGKVIMPCFNNYITINQAYSHEASTKKAKRLMS